MINFAGLTQGLMRYTYGLFHDWFAFSNSSKFRSVTAIEALSYAPIWFGVSKISGHIGQMPVRLYKTKNEKTEEMPSHPGAILCRMPGKYLTPMRFRQTLMMHALLDGNGRAAIVRRNGIPVELILLHPQVTLTIMIDGEVVHATRPPDWDRLRRFFPNVDGTDSEQGVIVIPDSDVIHVTGLSEDGIVGLPLRKVCGKVIGTGLDADGRVSKQMRDGFMGRIFFQAPAGVMRDEQQAKEFLEAAKQRHSSDGQGEDIGLLREGITANVVDLNNREAEMAALRIFQRQDAALLLGLEGILGDDASVSYNSAEQKNLAYLSMLGKWIEAIEQEFNKKLLTERELARGQVSFQFDISQLLKADSKTTMEWLSLAKQNEIMTTNECRSKLNLNPIKGGDELRNPAINPANSPAESESSDDEPMESDGSSNTPPPDAVYRSRIEHLINVEANRMVAAAGRAKNFLQYVDNFYEKKWKQDFLQMITTLGLPESMAVEHCSESKRMLLEVADYSQPQDLAANVRKCVSTWPERVNNFLGTENVCI